MDSAAYILFAKEGRYFTLSTGTVKLDELDEFPCHCPICCQHTPKELKSFDEDKRVELLAKHNLYLSFSELRTIRQAIREGNLWELVEQRVLGHPSLVKAFQVARNNNSFIESSEKAYKKHGRMYVSSESITRPLIKRYDDKIIANYRPPKEAKFLILLPELDTRGTNSPSIISWLNQIKTTQVIPRELIHVVFISDFYGLIPLELKDTFPLSQYESITAMEEDDILHQNSVKKALAFLNTNIEHYEKCGVLIPEEFLNQFNETIKFPSHNPIHKINSILIANFASKVSNFNNLFDLFQFFRVDGKQ
jgi:7-cyano-7-deazaguanine tRNA-ribosyltransferase